MDEGKELIRALYDEIKDINNYIKNTQIILYNINVIKSDIENMKKEVYNLNNKIFETEIEGEKEIKFFNEYDRIIIKDLESRISILEEEKEKYNIK